MFVIINTSWHWQFIQNNKFVYHIVGKDGGLIKLPNILNVFIVIFILLVVKRTKTYCRQCFDGYYYEIDNTNNYNHICFPCEQVFKGKCFK